MQVKAVCAAPSTLNVTAGTCFADFNAANLLNMINLGNRAAGFRVSPVLPNSTAMGIPSTNYKLHVDPSRHSGQLLLLCRPNHGGPVDSYDTHHTCVH